MLIIQDKLVSDAIVEEHFICNLKACKGECCRAGDYGAPLDEEEIGVLEMQYDKISPFLTEAGRKAIEWQGKAKWEEDEEIWATTLIDNGPCAYFVEDELGIAHCGIEMAHRAGAIDFKKPISCHLYPIREKKTAAYVALNYHEWDICSAACLLGKNKKVRVFEFLREPLIRAYGKDFYDELEAAANRVGR